MVFHRIFPLYGNLYIPKHWELHGFSSTLNLLGSEEYGKSLCFPILFLYYVNSLFPYFGNCLDFCFTQTINLKCLRFPILFLHYGNPLFLCFWNCMDFCFIRKILKKNFDFEIFVFPIFFPYYGNSLFPYFGNSMAFCFTQNI